MSSLLIHTTGSFYENTCAWNILSKHSTAVLYFTSSTVSTKFWRPYFAFKFCRDITFANEIVKVFFHVFPWPSALECKGLNILQWNKIKHDLSNLQCRKRNLLAQSDVSFFHDMKSGTLKRNTRYWQEMRSTEIVTKTGTSKNVLGNLIFKNLKQLQLLRS